MIYTFGDFELDTQRYELRQSGAPCALDPLSFNVLLYLVEHRDRVISKDELLEQLWPNQIVSESTLTQRLRTVRQAVGDSGREQHTIKTTHGRGYRFIATVQERRRDEATADSREEAGTQSCPACQQVNTDEARFCSTCGAVLRPACPACGQENAPQAQFCHACGISLQEGTQDIPETQPVEDTDLPSDDRQTAAGERRQLTVVFCDLADSTALARQHDPEDLHDMLRTYHQHGAAVMQRYEGHIAQYLGDGLLVYFGYPQAHEDDAGRAIRASLELLDSLTALNTELTRTYGAEITIRIGIHTGLVVVGEMGGAERSEHLALGETPNTAFRLQELATPNGVVISEATYRLVEGFFVCEALGPQTLKGYPQPQMAYQVLRPSSTQSRLEVAALRGLTPFTGRTQEVGLMLERWEEAQEGLGQVVVLNGEAGIGKSRLVRVLQEHVAGNAHAWLRGRCSPYHQHTALYPVVELIQAALQWQETDTPAVQREKLEQAARQAHLDVEEHGTAGGRFAGVTPCRCYGSASLSGP